MDNFENIKVGEKLIMSRLWYDPQVVTVEKVTNTTFTAGGVVFNKRTGRQRGDHDSFSFWYVSIPTEGEIEKINKDATTKRYVKYLKAFDYSTLPLETLQEIYKLTKN